MLSCQEEPCSLDSGSASTTSTFCAVRGVLILSHIASSTHSLVSCHVVVASCCWCLAQSVDTMNSFVGWLCFLLFDVVF